MHINRSPFLTAAAMLSLMPLAAAAQGLPVKKYLPLDVAQIAASTAEKTCRAQGFSVTVYILDRMGETITMMRGDAASPHHVASSRRKAYTALTFKMPSGDLDPFIEKHPAAAALKDMDGVIALGGGLPIRSGEEIVGAIGVAGATGSDSDVGCAQAGLNAIAPRLK